MSSHEHGQSSDNQMVALPLMSDAEYRVLELYDRLLELQVEIALLRAYQDHLQGGDHQTEVPERDVTASQDALLESRAALFLRRDVVDSVMTVKPILSAVHNRIDASHIERDLFPLIEQRDASSTAVLKSSASLRKLLDQLTTTEAETIRATRRNVQLATQLLQLAESERQQAVEPHEDQAERIAALGRELKTSRQRWKVIKGAASAIVVGSGVDWAGDAELRYIVLDSD